MSFQIERLVKENQGMKQEKLELESKFAKQEIELRMGREEKTKIEAGYFNAASEVSLLRNKEASRVKAENEVVELRKELLLLGEIIRKYRERATMPKGRLFFYSFGVPLFRGNELAKNKIDLSQLKIQ